MLVKLMTRHSLTCECFYKPCAELKSVRKQSDEEASVEGSLPQDLSYFQNVVEHDRMLKNPPKNFVLLLCRVYPQNENVIKVSVKKESIYNLSKSTESNE